MRSFFKGTWSRRKKLTLQVQTVLAWKILLSYFDLVVKYEASCWEIEMQFWSDCVPCHLLTTSWRLKYEAICFAIVLQFNFLYCLTFLISGVIMLSVASTLNRSLVFYHRSTMAIGIILVILVVLFQVV
jgi:hypothetical protein